MRVHRIPSSRLRPLAASCIALSVLGILGCSSAPDPEPSPTPAFASEEEAFAAAEQTYRAYIAALNAVDLSDTSSFESVFALTTGEFQKGDRENLSELHANGMQMSGESVVTGFVGVSTSREQNEAVARVCVDVSQVKIVNQAGESGVSADRPPRYAIDATFSFQRDKVLIQSAARSDAVTCE